MGPIEYDHFYFNLDELDCASAMFLPFKYPI